MLEVRNISKSYNDHSVLQDISFTAEPGSITILLGASGSGKSTILRILNDLDRADTGTITLDGTHIDPTQEHQTRRIGMVFQNFNVFTHMSVLRNITFTLEKACNMSAEDAQQRAYELLGEYHLIDRADACARDISGGQQQRLAIARTVAVQPDVICLDEPTSALDPYLTDHVAAVIRQLAQTGYTVILTTHDANVVKQLSGLVHLLQNGHIIAQAKSETIFEKPSESPEIADFIGIESIG